MQLLGLDQLELIATVGEAQLLCATGMNLHYTRHSEFLSEEQIAYIYQKRSKADQSVLTPNGVESLHKIVRVTLNC